MTGKNVTTKANRAVITGGIVEALIETEYQKQRKSVGQGCGREQAMSSMTIGSGFREGQGGRRHDRSPYFTLAASSPTIPTTSAIWEIVRATLAMFCRAATSDVLTFSSATVAARYLSVS